MGRGGRSGGGGERRPVGRSEGPGWQKRLEGEGSIRMSGATLRIAFSRHFVSSVYRSVVTHNVNVVLEEEGFTRIEI
ncbi:hypothetical protein H8959_007410 [Pygathrix nigripes]